MRKSVIIIPARLSATRLPRKPLLKINNIPMVIHTMRLAKKSNIGNVIVATPDKEIFDLVEKYSGKAMMTKKDHLSGTDRVAEAVAKLSDNDISLQSFFFLNDECPDAQHLHTVPGLFFPSPVL